MLNDINAKNAAMCAIVALLFCFVQASHFSIKPYTSRLDALELVGNTSATNCTRIAQSMCAIVTVAQQRDAALAVIKGMGYFNDTFKSEMEKHVSLSSYSHHHSPPYHHIMIIIS